MAAADATVERERMEYDVVIVGAGPAGLATAIRLKQLAAAGGREVSVCVLEKGSEVGAHILSGAVLEPRALDELIPDWQAQGAPVTTPVREEKFLVLGPAGAVTLPNFILPPSLRNHGNWVISLGNLCRWLGQQAEALGVEIYPGFPAADLIVDDGRIRGVVTGDMGVGRDGAPGPNYQPGMELRATYTVFAEGCRGSLGKRLMRHFGLREGADPQTYGIGLKELWEVDPAQHRPGLVVHSVGWPLGNGTYGGSFLYHLDNNQAAVGFVVGLDYANPYLAPFEEFQRFKTHPAIRPTFEGGRRISYGARALNEGGLQSLPKLTFPGGLLVGCEAGTLVVPKIKGTHTAMKSGMVAAETLHAALGEDAPPAEPASYGEALRRSWVWQDLHVARNFRPSFRWGLVAGTLLAGFDQVVLRGRAPWTLHHRHADHEALVDKRRARRIVYPKPDGVVTFDRLSSVFVSNTNHEEDQPVHLRLADERIPVAVNLARWDAPEQRYCPAGVYEIVEEGGGARLQINAQNCVHCKTCDIKDPTQNIDWATPEGGGGPNYPNM